MKKTLSVAALAAVLVFAFAGSAFAGMNASGQQRLGAAATSTANVANLAPGQTNPVAGAGTLTYQNWSLTTLGNASPASGNTPHGNYTTTTVKCAVCHAVHYAAPGGAPVGQGQAADTLLRMRAQDACIYCHATAGVAVNGRPVYNGLGSAIGSGGGDMGHVTGTNCSTCHTGVHGANQDNSVASLAGYLLKKQTVAGAFATGPVAQPSNTDPGNPGNNVESASAPVTTTDMIGAIAAINNGAVNQGFADGAALNGTVAAYAGTNSSTLREQAVGVFCAECHDGSYSQAAAGASTNVSSSNTAFYSGHRIAASANANWNVGGSVSSSALTSGPVAWAAAVNCRSCHDATDNSGASAFPHAWGKYTTAGDPNNGARFWLTAAPTAAAGTNTPLSMTAANAGNQLTDGVCLKCHVASGGAAGVGITF